MPTLKRNIQNSVRLFKQLSGTKNKDLESVQSLQAMPFKTDQAWFNFTIDFELFWGNGQVDGSDHSIIRRVDAAKRLSENFWKFTEMSRELGFKISWAVVGKMLNPEFVPPENLQFKPSWGSDNWYELPKQIHNSPELWNGEEYIGYLKKHHLQNEILSHGFGHIDYCDISTSEEIAKFDIEKSLNLLRASGMDAKGFVYPCNKVNFPELLLENGIGICRGESSKWDFRRSLVQTPIGFWISPGMMSFKDLKSMVKKAIENRSFLHLWMHLIEMDLKEKDLDDFYRPLFEMILELQSRGLMRVVSFAEIKEKIDLEGINR